MRAQILRNNNSAVILSEVCRVFCDKRNRRTCFSAPTIATNFRLRTLEPRIRCPNQKVTKRVRAGVKSRRQPRKQRTRALAPEKLHHRPAGMPPKSPKKHRATARQRPCIVLPPGHLPFSRGQVMTRTILRVLPCLFLLAATALDAQAQGRPDQGADSTARVTLGQSAVPPQPSTSS